MWFGCGMCPQSQLEKLAPMLKALSSAILASITLPTLTHIFCARLNDIHEIVSFRTVLMIFMRSFHSRNHRTQNWCGSRSTPLFCRIWHSILTGVTQLKIGDVCWRASETVLGVDNAKSGIKRARGELFS